MSALKTLSAKRKLRIQVVPRCKKPRPENRTEAFFNSEFGIMKSELRLMLAEKGKNYPLNLRCREMSEGQRGNGKAVTTATCLLNLKKINFAEISAQIKLK